MWISRNIISRSSKPVVDTASADSGIDNRVSAVSAQGKGQCEIINPPGILSVPGRYNDIFVIPTERGQACIGVRIPYYERNIEPGEILLMSDGGASIKLSNNGKVYINGEEIHS